MPKFKYVALDSRGRETAGVMEVASQSEALVRLKEIGVFPTKVAAAADKPRERRGGPTGSMRRSATTRRARFGAIHMPGLSGRVKPKVLTAFARQLATLVDAGLPLLRGLRLLEAQQSHPTLKRIIG